MAATLRDMINAGACRQLCLYHHRRGNSDRDWTLTKLYALREFRDVPTDVIFATLDYCVTAYSCTIDPDFLAGDPDNYGPKWAERWNQQI
jgi:hypothetical protein